MPSCYFCETSFWPHRLPTFPAGWTCTQGFWDSLWPLPNSGQEPLAPVGMPQGPLRGLVCREEGAQHRRDTWCHYQPHTAVLDSTENPWMSVLEEAPQATQPSALYIRSQSANRHLWAESDPPSRTAHKLKMKFTFSNDRQKIKRRKLGDMKNIYTHRV